jgi:hypothetical protein
MLPAYSLDAKGHQGIVAACTRNSENMVAWCAQFSDVVNGGLVVLSAIDKCGEKVGEGQREGKSRRRRSKNSVSRQTSRGSAADPGSVYASALAQHL